MKDTMFYLVLATWKYPSASPEAWAESTMIVSVSRVFKVVKAQVCQCSPLQVEEMRADKGYAITSNTRNEGNYKGRGMTGKERRVGIGQKERTCDK